MTAEEEHELRVAIVHLTLQNDNLRNLNTANKRKNIQLRAELKAMRKREAERQALVLRP